MTNIYGMQSNSSESNETIDNHAFPDSHSYKNRIV